METELQAARIFLYQAAWKLDQGAPDATKHCAMAKRLVTDTAFRVANDALQLLGGYGYLSDYGIEKIVRDLRVHQILEGTNEIMRVIIARALLADAGMSDIHIRTEGRAGRITLTRPQALNALTHAMALAIDAALARWRDDPDVALVLIDAEGPRAFCAGGDLAEIYDAGRRGDFAYPRRFWAEEYRMNAAVARFPKPYVALTQGYVLGGGVGIASHGSHRVVGETSRIAMPECAIGLIPDVGGSHLLAQAPGRLGEYLGLSGHRMGPGDAIHAGFADHFVPEADWPALAARLVETGDPAADRRRRAPGPGRPRCPTLRREIDDAFSAAGPRDAAGPAGGERLGRGGARHPRQAVAAVDGLHAGAGPRRPRRAGRRAGPDPRVPLHRPQPVATATCSRASAPR